MNLKHCIVRVGGREYIIPTLKGEFLWIGSESAKTKCYRNM